MEFTTVIKKRRSIRKFKNDNINDETIKQLIEAARLAPSAKNRQPWKFYIARNEVKSTIVDLMKEWQSNNKNTQTSVLGTADAISQAPVLILVFKDSISNAERSDTLSLGAAIEHVLLKATEMNLGSLWIADTYYIKEKISKLIKTNLELYSAIAIGISDEDPDQRPRKGIEDILMN